MTAAVLVPGHRVHPVGARHVAVTEQRPLVERRPSAASTADALHQMVGVGVMRTYVGTTLLSGGLLVLHFYEVTQAKVARHP